MVRICMQDLHVISPCVYKIRTHCNFTRWNAVVLEESICTLLK